MTNNSITFEVPGDPMGKQRPRFQRRGNFVKTYTPAETVSFEHKVAHYARIAMGENQCLTGAVGLTIKANFVMPKYLQRKKPTETQRKKTKPDWDNIGKIVSDALNGVAWLDDSQVTWAIVEKWHSKQGDPGNMTVTIHSIEKEWNTNGH